MNEGWPELRILAPTHRTHVQFNSAVYRAREQVPCLAIGREHGARACGDGELGARQDEIEGNHVPEVERSDVGDDEIGFTRLVRLHGGAAALVAVDKIAAAIQAPTGLHLHARKAMVEV